MNAAPTASAPPPVLRRMGPPLAALAAVAVPAGYVAVVDPNAPGHYPDCPFLTATGWWCPGCGGLRCVHALAHGDLTGALHDNAVAVLLFGVLGVLWLRWSWAALTLGPPVRVSVGARRWALIGLLVLVFEVVRNLSIGAGLAPPVV
ncbi:DUF2752 domain-containing protein [Kitasatospora aureofaciens]|uniref:DUF2752 domain-containing protein n=2 Tax=Kitasatospora aureofaciens TaxID=1894 RepID=A0A8H9HGQ4_KITAU|nr:DUF2752 domain-containing protein [Kitasatospora aureofaciens]UKZ08534.1 DUF2752 domain-containing protein [Streptomyces viridifaciens]GGU62081.1 hypothetical protein GCM10010502_11070 [Kitasatospora aureofaciens]HJD80170.1 DUF2752 domain-containing protein [Kitasatospora aureofaciens]